MIAGSYSSYSKCCSPFRYGCAATTQKCAATDLVGGQKSGGFSWSTQSTLGSSELAPMFEKQTLFLRHLEKIKSLQTTTTPTQTPTTTTRTTTTTTTTTKKNMHDWKTISCYKWNRSLIDPCYIIDTFGVSPYVPSNHVTNPLDHPRTGKSWHRLCLGIVLWNRSAMKIYETHTSSTSGIMKYDANPNFIHYFLWEISQNHHTFASSSRWVIWWSLYLTHPHKQTSRSPIMNILQRLPQRLAMTIWCLVWEVFFVKDWSQLESTWYTFTKVVKRTYTKLSREPLSFKKRKWQINTSEMNSNESNSIFHASPRFSFFSFFSFLFFFSCFSWAPKSSEP